MSSSEILEITSSELESSISQFRIEESTTSEEYTVPLNTNKDAGISSNNKSKSKSPNRSKIYLAVLCTFSFSFIFFSSVLILILLFLAIGNENIVHIPHMDHNDAFPYRNIDNFNMYSFSQYHNDRYIEGVLILPNDGIDEFIFSKSKNFSYSIYPIETFLYPIHWKCSEKRGDELKNFLSFDLLSISVSAAVTYYEQFFGIPEDKEYEVECVTTSPVDERQIVDYFYECDGNFTINWKKVKWWYKYLLKKKEDKKPRIFCVEDPNYWNFQDVLQCGKRYFNSSRWFINDEFGWVMKGDNLPLNGYDFFGCHVVKGNLTEVQEVDYCCSEKYHFYWGD